MSNDKRHIDALGGNISNDELLSWYAAYQPVGSGPLGAMRNICILIEQLAKDRGLELPPARGIK